MRSSFIWAAGVLTLLATCSIAGSAEPVPGTTASSTTVVAPAPVGNVAPQYSIPVADREALSRRLEQAEGELAALRSMLGTPPSAISSSSPLSNAQAPGTGDTYTTPDGSGAPPDPSLPNAAGGDFTAQEGLGADAPEAGFQMPGKPKKIGLKAQFGNGFELKSEDEEWTWQAHNLTQFDGRFYGNGKQQTVKDTFVFPRQWFIFNGRLTKPFEYYVSIAEGFDTLNILDCFLNVHYDDRLQLKIGRFKTPFTYEFYNEPIFGLISPERSLFFNNFGLNRDLGVMAWGMLFDKKVDYAVGVFNGRRNGLIDTNNDKDVAAYLNFKPFLERKGSFFENFNFGYSINCGRQDNTPPIPNTFRTIVPTLGNDIVGVPFLTFNPNVAELGPRALNSAHFAHYYKQLSLIGEWQFGTQNYAFNTSREFQRAIPVQSYYLQAGYFLTGETVSARGTCDPIRPFDIRKGKFGLGAWELQSRYNYMDISRSIFTSGLSNPNLYANALSATDLGFNWYLNQYIKFSFEWERDQFSDPTLFRTLADGTPLRQCHSDLFLFRTQIWF